MFYIDLDELEVLTKKLRWFSYNQFNLFSFRDKDHLELNKLEGRKDGMSHISHLNSPIS